VPRLVLWDVDHTLIENAGVSKEIYAAAFTTLTGRAPTQLAPTEGRTDPDIMAEMLHGHGERDLPWPTIERALEQAGIEHRHALAERGAILPGVLDLVAELARRNDVVQTIVTGNIRANAEVKVSSFGLVQWFDLDVGGYGSDDQVRSRLVAIARGRAAVKHGSEFGRPENAIVIGDTPRDVEAARQGGAEILAVASGIHGLDELRASGATLAIPSLVDTAAVMALLLGSSTSDATGPNGTP
jgi:phosphoglycolate phosphatase-like HAD superfamily hydrolase